MANQQRRCSRRRRVQKSEIMGLESRFDHVEPDPESGVTWRTGASHFASRNEDSGHCRFLDLHSRTIADTKIHHDITAMIGTREPRFTPSHVYAGIDPSRSGDCGLRRPPSPQSITVADCLRHFAASSWRWSGIPRRRIHDGQRRLQTSPTPSKPAHRVHVDDYWMGGAPTSPTNSSASFVEATGHVTTRGESSGGRGNPGDIAMPEFAEDEQGRIWCGGGSCSSPPDHLVPSDGRVAQWWRWVQDAG